MDRNTGGLDWSDEQWSRANKIVQQEAQKARVAGQFLPTYVQGDATATAVPRRALSYNQRLAVDSDPTIFLTSLAVNIHLTSQEAGDPEQSAALLELRRAANLIARLEDALILGGRKKSDDADPLPGAKGLPKVYAVSGGGSGEPGLHSSPSGVTDPSGRQAITADATDQDLAGKIIDATSALEGAGHNRPFACVLGPRLYSRMHNPTISMVLPRDRVVPVLEGPLLRSSTLPALEGIVVALGGSPIEIVISSELHVRFLQITTEPYFVLRVSERIGLRVTDWSAVAVIKAADDAPASAARK